MFVRFCLLLLMLSLAGCSVLPREGPLSAEIEQQSVESDYIVIDITSDIVRTLAGFDPVGLGRRFGPASYRVPRQVIGVGDVLSVSIFEAGQGGLFSGDHGNRAEFPSIAVDRGGVISIPYAGRIRVRGKTSFQVQEAIVAKLEGKAIQPQAIVNIIKNESNTVTISGDVAKPGLYPISLRGRRILDVIAEAGGTKFAARETYVSFIRGKRHGVQLLKTIIEVPKENIFITNGDRVYLSHDPRRYTVLGAVNKPGLYKFDAPHISILEAVASAKGLMDARADSTGLFVFRYEAAQILDKIGVSYTRTVRGRVPTIYRINMKHAKSYFYAQSFLLQNKDSIFVSNAEGVELMKMLRIVNAATASFRGGVGVVNTVNGF